MKIVGRGLADRVTRAFPAREFIMRAEGRVRFVRIGTAHQVSLLGAATLALLGVGGAWAMSHHSQQVAEGELARREAALARTAADLASERAGTAQTLHALAERQRFLEAMWETLPRPEEAGSADMGDAATAPAPERISAAEAVPTTPATIAARQVRFARALAAHAERRAQRAEQALARLGLSSAVAGPAGAMGGPFEKWDTGTAGDPVAEQQFERLGRSLARLDGLEAMLARLPQVSPAEGSVTTSGFGYRRDPFTGAAALHKGLDFAGPTGAPIRAAAPGRISFVGQKGGYGNVVEITHGANLVTRYAHLSRFAVRPGEQVAAGAVIGGLGNTGRSTGPHLHFEVRLGGRPVNPRPFLETARNVLKEVRLPAGTAARGL